MNQQLLRTPFYEVLKNRGGKMVPFAGYEMPVQFKGIMAEHAAVRTEAGLFDVSHMGEVWIEGEGACDYAHYLVTNDINSLNDGHVAYTPMCHENGGIVDDLLVYKYSKKKILLVVNAANREKDLKHIVDHAPSGVRVIDRSLETAQLALQGPKSLEILQGLTPINLNTLLYFTFKEDTVAGRPCIISRTGYTGEDGFELYCSNENALAVFNALMEVGESLGLELIGLGARDTLRLEAKLCLYGNDIDDTTNPLEAGLGWTVKLEVGDFLGRDVIVKQKEEGVSRRLLGFEMIDKAIARHGYDIVSVDDPSGTPIGKVASGSPSPTLDKNIGLAYFPKKGYKIDTEFGVIIRKKMARAKVVKTPFYKRSE